MSQVAGYFVAGGAGLPVQGFVADLVAVVGAGIRHKRAVDVGPGSGLLKKDVALDDGAAARHWVWDECAVLGICDSTLLNLLVRVG